MEIKIGLKKIEFNVKKSRGIKGLMFCQRENADALVFKSQGAIHSCFVFFDFLVLWLDSENRVVDYKIVKPWNLCEKSGKKFDKILEIPINQRYEEVIGEILS